MNVVRVAARLALSGAAAALVTGGGIVAIGQVAHTPVLVVADAPAPSPVEAERVAALQALYPGHVVVCYGDPINPSCFVDLNNSGVFGAAERIEWL